ncbi:DUF488 domain-containing protein [Candidatus Paracaedibacter symbiosus]|uniref:DUF488 domain-containing protein n=1 Tax=Candidatus Paracaedibacter symbiosus TaxID=244582 RepID=UPI000509CB9F|nr:DUF488 domain-containing protein [Candidatus Paracaedibacter symbiosus]
MTELNIKRIYQPVENKDGIRILVDGLWPRGIKKEDAKIDLWLKEIAPSASLRKWFNHVPTKWDEFCKRYHEELTAKQTLLHPIIELLKTKNVTLLYSAKGDKINNANALKEYILSTFPL